MLNAHKEIICPRCASARVLALSPAVRDWFCCAACGHMWPKPAPEEGEGKDLPR